MGLCQFSGSTTQIAACIVGWSIQLNYNVIILLTYYNIMMLLRLCIQSRSLSFDFSIRIFLCRPQTLFGTYTRFQATNLRSGRNYIIDIISQIFHTHILYTLYDSNYATGPWCTQWCPSLCASFENRKLKNWFFFALE